MTYKLKFAQNSDVIFTTYFTSKENPQAGTPDSFSYAPKNNLSFIFPWYSSVVFHNLNGVIIHDGLDEKFIAQYEKNNIQFVYYKPAKFSLNDERFFALDYILRENRLGKVLLTDGSDVLIKRNPFHFMTDSSMLYFGSDEPTLPKIRQNAWCIQKLIFLAETKAISIDDTILDFEYINAGVYGGYYENLRSFNEALTILFNQINNSNNNNMLAINYLLWKFKINHFKGQPFTSPFKKYQLHGDYFIVHK